jgi:hypothetical protein
MGNAGSRSGNEVGPARAVARHVRSSRRIAEWVALRFFAGELSELGESKSTARGRSALTTFVASRAGSGRSSQDAVVRVRQARWTVFHAKLELRIVHAHERRSPGNVGASKSRVYDET